MQFAIAPCPVAAADGVARNALDGAAFEDVEVDVLVVGLGRDGAFGVGVPDHDVGVAADPDRALARVQIEDLGGIGGGQADEVLGGEAPGVDAFVPQHRHAVLDPGGAVGNLREVVLAHLLLLGAEAAVIGGGGLQVSGLDAAPQCLTVLQRAERRAHHVAGREFPALVLIDLFIDQQMACQHLAVDRLTVLAGVADLLQRIGGGDVDQIHRRAQGAGDADGAAGSFALDLRRTRQRMRLRAGDAVGQQLLLQVVDQLAVLGMHGGNRAQFQTAREARDEGVVRRHDGVLVGHEVLEAVDAVIGDQRRHVLADALVPPGDGDVEAVVAARLLGPFAPGVIGLHQRLLGRGDHEIDDHGGAAGQRRGGAGLEVLAGHGAHEGQLHVGVRVDAAGHHQTAAGVDHFAVVRYVQVGADGGDGLAVTQHIGGVALFVGLDAAALDQDCHESLPAASRGLVRH